MSFLNPNNKTFKELKLELDTYRLFFLGETHGVKQNIDLIKELFIRCEFECIALEWFDILYPALIKDLSSDNFKLTLKERAFKILCEDGRGSLLHLNLLKELFKSKSLKSLILYADSSQYVDWNTREVNYLNNFINKYDKKLKTLIVGGNLHSKTVTFKDSFEKGTLKPMAYLLKEKIGYFPTGKINYLSGEYYNIGIKKFSRSNIRKQESKIFKIEDTYNFVIDNARALVP